MAGQSRPGTSSPPDLWDPVVRLTHWTIAMAVVLNGLVTRGGGSVHVAIGWAVIALLSLRILWGFIGPAEARFAAFPPSPMGALRHLADLVAGRPREYPSHNPAGAIMIYALWASLAVVIATGLTMTQASPLTIAAQERAVAEGDWSQLVTEDGEGDEGEGDEGGGEMVKEIHETAANLMLVLALLHLGGVVMESRAMRRNLVRPMLFGGRGSASRE